MSTAHTPGPWTLEERPGRLNFIRARGACISGVVAQVNAAWPGPDQCDEQLANARLIVAAPDMLGLLRDAYSVIATQVADGENTLIAARIRELVAKVIA